MGYMWPSENSDESAHPCNFTRAVSAQLQTARGICDQRMFRWVCAYVQAHLSFLCSPTNGIRYRWPVTVQMSMTFVYVQSHQCSFCLSIYRWSEKVLMSLSMRTASHKPSLLIFKGYELYMTRESSDESVHMYRLTWAFSVHQQIV